MNMSSFRMGVICCFVIVTQWAGAQVDSLIGPQQLLKYPYDAETNSCINGQGRLIKRDSGHLVYLDAAMFRGEIRVESGRVTLGTSSDNKLTDLPYASNPSLTNGLSLWVDASSNVVSDAGSVSMWMDVRDIPGASQTNYPWAALPSGATAPLVTADGVSFGALGSGAWLQWADAATNDLRMTDIQTVVMAVSSTGGGGCFLGDGTLSDFARGNTSADGSRLLFGYGVSSPYLIQGDVYVDEKRVDALKSSLGEGERVLSFLTRSGPGGAPVSASNFGNDRNLQTGGFTLLEVLVYDRVLKASERIRVSEYLDGKWFKRSMAGDFDVTELAELEVAPESGSEIKSDRLQGRGTLIKSGDGQWVLQDADTSFDGQVVLQSGSITNTSAVARSLPFSVSSDSLSVVAGPRSWQVAGNQTAGVMEKSGSGEWLVTGLPQDNLDKISVLQGTLRLAGRELASASEANTCCATVFSDSFEYPYEDLAYQYINYGIKYSLGTYGDGWVEWPQIGWTCRVNDPNTGTPRNPSIVLCDEGYNPALVVAGGNQDGRNAMLLQGTGEIKRMVDIPAAGDYVLRFWAAARNASGCENHNFDVCFGGVVQTNILTTYSSAFHYYQVVLTNLTAGAHELRFTGTNTLAPTESYRASVLDSISICAVADNGIVPDPGFEAGAWATSSPSNPTDGVWTFSGDSGWSAAISFHSSNLYKRGAPEGVKVAWMKNLGTFASANVSFTQAGTYALSFLTSGRQVATDETGGEALDGCWPGHDYRVFFNGSACGYARTMNRRFERREMMFDVAAPGTYTLRFTGINEGNFQYFRSNPEYKLTRSSLVDCVRLRQVDSFAIPDYSFENANNDNWKWVGNGTVTSARGNNYVPDNELPDGPNTSARGGILMGTGQMYQDITFPSDGVFKLSFYAAGRFLYDGGLDPERTTAAARLGHDFRVCIDGESVMTVQTMDEIYHLYSVRLPALKAGVHRLSFDGINTLGGTERGSSFDAVRLVSIDTASTDDLLLAETAIEVAAGAVLHLDYFGTNDVKSVKLGGIEPSGFITAERFPSYITGEGVLFTQPKGTLILVN